MRKSLTQRFWEKVDVKGPDECWPWKAGRINKKYGAFGMKVGGKNTMVGAHRVAFFLTHGYWPLFACHTCDNYPCCNPNHIYDGTPLDNSTDMVQRFRSKRLKLTKKQGQEVFSLREQGRNNRWIANHFGVHITTIERIFMRQTKSHLLP